MGFYVQVAPWVFEGKVGQPKDLKPLLSEIIVEVQPGKICYRIATARHGTGRHRVAQDGKAPGGNPHRRHPRHGTAHGGKRRTKFARRGSGVRIPSSPPNFGQRSVRSKDR